jgi:hypothetical protein
MNTLYMHNIFYLDGHNVVKVHIMHIFFDVVSGNGELQNFIRLIVNVSNILFSLYD